MKKLIAVITMVFLMFRLIADAEVYNGKELILLSKPYHFGDNVDKSFSSPKPQGSELKMEFQIESPSTTYIGIWARGIIPKSHGDFKKGHYITKLIINDKEIILNKKLFGKKESVKFEKIIIQISGRDLKKGINTFIIKAGAKGSNYDDFEIQKIIISKTKPK